MAVDTGGIEMKQVRVTYHREAEGWWAEADVPGFTAAADGLSDLRKMAAEGLEFYLDAPVALTEFLDSGAQITNSWATEVAPQRHSVTVQPGFAVLQGFSLGPVRKSVPAA